MWSTEEKMNDFDQLIHDQLETELQKKIYELIIEHPKDYDKIIDQLIEYIDRGQE